MNLTKRFSLIVSAAALCMAASSYAAIIAPNTNTFALNEPGPVGATLVATQTIPFVTATYTGSLTSTVYSGDVSNPLGGLTFTYQISNATTSAHAITRLAVNGFSGFTTDMSFNNTLGGTLAPTLNDRDAGGNVIGFTYIGAPIGFGTIAAGTTTNLMVVQTNATGYRGTLSNVIDGSIAVVDSYAPVVVPEPATAGVLLAAGLIRRRR